MTMIFLKQTSFLILGSILLLGAYAQPADYESGTAQEKTAYLLDQVQLTSGQSGKLPNFFGLARFILSDDLSPTVEHVSDFLPYSHEKRIHSVGAVATMALDIIDSDQGYTGIFETGTQHAVVRLSLAAKGGIIPGLAVKFLRDGMPSANFVAMNSVDAQDSGDFFERSFSNHIDETRDFAKKIVARKFAKVSDPAEFVGLSDIASYSVEGEEVEEANFPFEIILIPNKDLQQQQSDDAGDSIESVLTSIPVGTKLYDVHARVTPSSEDTELIGVMRITSQLVYTSFGDSELFFRHQKFEEDLELKPEWNNSETVRGLRGKCPLGMDVAK